MNYSIIIPHKNSADLVERLLNSIPKREDLEIILIDDGSHSEELEKLKKIRSKHYFDLYNNIGKVGAGASRNLGLDNAKGKFVVFADSDDFFSPNFEQILNEHINGDLEISFYKVHSVDSETYKESHRHLFFNDLIDKFLEEGKRDFLYKYSVPWGKIYKRSFLEVNKIRFAEVIAGNDMWFACTSGVFARNFEVKEEILYTVTVRDGSIVNTIKPEYFLSRFDETLRVNNMLRKKKLNSYQYSILYFLFNAHKFGATRYVIKEIFRNKSNILIGLEKILNYKKVMVDRENRRKPH